MSEPALVRDAVRSDAESVAAIYNHYIENTVITFEETQVTHDQIAARMESIQRDYPPPKEEGMHSARRA